MSIALVLIASLGLLPSRLDAAVLPDADREFAATLNAGQAAILRSLKAPGPRANPAAIPAADPIEEVVAALGKLPGQVSFQLQRLDPQPQVLYKLNPDVQLAIGSTFKLYILAAL